MKYSTNLVIIAALIIGFSCRNHETSTNIKSLDKNGGTLVLSQFTEIESFFPTSITLQNEALIVTQIHARLLRLNPKTLEVTPGIAKSWDTSNDGRKITFHLYNNVYFHDDKCFIGGKGPKVTSKDVKFTFEHLASQAEDNYYFASILKDRLVGVSDFYNKAAHTISGIEIIDDFTISFTLDHPSINFLLLLANPSASIISEIAYKIYGSNLKIGAGPYKYDVSSTSKKIVLSKNQNFFEKDSSSFSLPYLDTIVVKVFPSIEEGLLEFEKGTIDFIGTIPSLKVKNIVEKDIADFKSNSPTQILNRESEMVTQFYVFNTKKTPFNSLKVRQAINYAIDRQKIVDYILQGQATSSATNGITPNTFRGYNIADIKGYDFDVIKAKKLLAEAGFPEGLGFPKVQLLVNSGNSRSSSVAVEIQKQLKQNLKINLDFELLPTNKKFELEIIGKGDIFKTGWVADYPSPESFLSIFVGRDVPNNPSKPSFPNTARYQNKLFDEYYFKGRHSINLDTAYFYFNKAEQLLINEAPIIPLWYESSYKLISSKVKNFPINALRYYDFTHTYKIK
jgi:oligopeptide transport system substrate-binding protein